MRFLNALILGLCLLSCSVSIAQEDEDQQAPEKPAWGIVEEYDSVIVLTIENSHSWQYNKILFIRKGRIIADRYLSDEMSFVAVGDRWHIFWRDNWHPAPIDRLVITDRIVQITVEQNPEDNSGEWWAANRRMTDLEAPPE